MTSSDSLVLLLVFLVVMLLSLLIVWGFYRMGKTIEIKSEEANDAFKTKERLEKELLTSNIELQDHALHFTSMELHDNIGQVISIVRTKLTMTKDNDIPQSQMYTIVDEAIDQLGKVLKDIRNIARSINSELIEELGIVEAIRKELSFIKDLFKVDCQLVYDEGNGLPDMDNMQNIFLFRIVQEAIQNILAHAHSSIIIITVVVVDNKVQIAVEDNGIGFDFREKKEGMGIRSMHYRAKLLNARLEIASVEGRGTIVSIIL